MKDCRPNIKRLRFLSGEGNGSATIPGGQVLSVSVVPDAAVGSWVVLNESKPIFVPPNSTLSLTAKELGQEDGNALQWPGDGQILIQFDSGDNLNGKVPLLGPPISWLVIYTGC